MYLQGSRPGFSGLFCGNRVDHTTTTPKKSNRPFLKFTTKLFFKDLCLVILTRIDAERILYKGGIVDFIKWRCRYGIPVVDKLHSFTVRQKYHTILVGHGSEFARGGVYIQRLY